MRSNETCGGKCFAFHFFVILRAALVARFVMSDILFSTSVVFIFKAVFVVRLSNNPEMLGILIFNLCNFYVVVSLFDQPNSIRYLFVNIFNLLLKTLLVQILLFVNDLSTSAQYISINSINLIINLSYTFFLIT